MYRLLLAFIGFGLLAPSANAQSTTLNRYEYWFDENYASHGSGTVSGVNVDLPALNISTAGLPNGPHNLRMRFRDSNGQWGSVVSRAFIQMWDSSAMTQYEYWFDEDDDDAHRVSVAVSGVNVDLPTESIDISHLGPGPHTLRIRFQDSQGQWSSVASRTFIRTLDPPYQITAVRYWLSNEQNPTDMQYHYFDAPVDSLDVVAELLDACMFPNGTGILKIQVRDNHAQWSSVITRTLNVTPTGVLAIAGIDHVGSFCPDEQVTFTATPQTGNAVATSYAWTIPSGNGWDFTPSTGPSISVTIGNVAGNISVVGTNACFDSVQASLPITLPSTPAQPAMSFAWDLQPCAGINVDYAVQPVSGVHYEWSGAATGSGSSIILVMVDPADTIITVTPYNTCDVAGTPLTASITVQHVPEAPEPITGNFDVCAGSSEDYATASGPIPGGGYRWYWPGENTQIGPNTSFTINFGSASDTLTLTPFNTCGDGPAVTQAISVVPPPDIPVINGEDHLCEGGSSVLSVTPGSGTTYAWNTNETGNSITVDSAGTYSVVADNGCGTSSASISVVVDMLDLAFIDGPSEITAAGTYTFTAMPSLPAATGYNWTFLPTMSWASSDTDHIDNIAYLDVNSAGIYTICVGANSTACQGDTICITTDSTVGIAPIADGTDEVSIYPNPSSGVFIIVPGEKGAVEYRVLNALGQEVFPATRSTGQITLDLTSLASGSYLLHWRGTSSNGQQTLLIQH
ncbi:MAG: T9SS type A sorting domain-containing protein [Flavobacteriales bacterium]